MDVELFGHTALFWLAAVIVGVLGTARLVRLVVFDTYPPAAWLRARWDAATENSGWNDLLHCAYCAAPWIGVATIAWAWASDFHWSWWAFYGFLALAYASAVFVAWDEPPGPD